MLENGNAVLVRLDTRREAVRRPWCVGRGIADGEAEASTWAQLVGLLRKAAAQAVAQMGATGGASDVAGLLGNARDVTRVQT